MGLRAKLLVSIVAVTVPIYASALYMSYEAAARRLEAGAQRDVDELAARLVASVDAVIRPIEGGIRTVAYQLEEIDPPPSQYSQRILGILKAWPDVYGSTIAVEVARDRANAAAGFAPYYFRRGHDFAFSDLAHEQYGYRQLPWYRRAADAGRPVWSLPYFDAGGGDIWMVTYSVPFYRRTAAARVMGGVVTADLDLEWVKRVAASARLGAVGMGWLLSPSVSKSFVASIGDTAGRVARFDAATNPDMIRAIGEQMLARRVSFALLPGGLTSKPAYLAVRDLETLGWRVMLVIPQADLLGAADELLTRQLWLGAAGLVFLIVAISVVAAGITRPIRVLAEAVGEAHENDLDLRLPDVSRRDDEVGVLTDALSRLRGALADHIRLRAQSLAEQARLDHELEIAASIQQSMLPRSGAAAELPTAIEVSAALRPAKQVGGDLYDYFSLPDGRILFAVGDVSDKGIPAALFMARLSALLRVLGLAGEPPDRLLAAINARLIEGNSACMFVTIGCGLLDVDSGRIQYASAGHESPLVRNAEGSVRALDTDGGPAIGIEAAPEFRLKEGCLAPGDTLVLFTDGVTEAEAPDGDLFGIDRFGALLHGERDGKPSSLVQRVVDTVAAHASGFHATDDLTVLAVRWMPAGVTTVLTGEGTRWVMQPDPSNEGIHRTQRHLHAILSARGVAPERIGDAELVVEEILANIVRAAAATAAGVLISVECELQPSDVVLTVRDDGPAFDPLAFPAPDLDAGIADRSIGGLGIPLIRHLASDCRYSRTGQSNVFEVRLSRVSDSPEVTRCH